MDLSDLPDELLLDELESDNVALDVLEDLPDEIDLGYLGDSPRSPTHPDPLDRVGDTSPPSAAIRPDANIEEARSSAAEGAIVEVPAPKSAGRKRGRPLSARSKAMGLHRIGSAPLRQSDSGRPSAGPGS